MAHLCGPPNIPDWLNLCINVALRTEGTAWHEPLPHKVKIYEMTAKNLANTLKIVGKTSDIAQSTPFVVLVMILVKSRNSHEPFLRYDPGNYHHIW